MVNLLSNEMKIQWATYSSSIPFVNVKHFSLWLDNIASKLCSVLPNLSLSKESTKANKSKDAKPVNFHSEADKCDVCNGTCNNVLNCQKFKSSTISERWEYQKSLKLCRTCLNKSKPKCCEPKPCGVDSSTRLHNPLLHSVKKSVPATLSNCHQDCSDTLYRILPVTMRKGNIKLDVYLFFDGGKSFQSTKVKWS